MPATKGVNLPYNIWKKAREKALTSDDDTIRGIIIDWIEKGMETEEKKNDNH